MNSELIMKSDVLDILFENRNKSYGAYVLRKFYNERIKISLAIMLGIASVLSAFTFINKNKKSGPEIEPNFTTVLGTIPEEPVIEPKERPKPNIKITPPVTQDKWLSNIVIVPKNVLPDKLPDDIEKNVIGTLTTKGKSDIFTVQSPTDSSSQTGEIKKEVAAIDYTKPIDKPEIEPAYPGGLKALREFLQKNLTNPNEMESGEEVAVNVKFVVGYDGKLKSFTVVKSGGDEFDAEVVRVLKKMPDWTPGRSNGQNVSVYTTIPVKFVGAE